LIAGAFIIVRPLELDTKRLRTLSEIDTLTGAYSRRMFIDRTTKEFNYSQKEGKPFSLLMIDVDYFKKINDVFGHAGGDVALTTLVAHISHLIHSSDYVGRLGGEEFAVVMPETSIEEALVVAERIRVSVDNLMLPYGNRYIKLSISIGVAGLTDEVNNISTLLKLADNALYVAKAQGRNKVTANKLNLVA
jgi:two-component system chemotaxis family response regulator WspR